MREEFLVFGSPRIEREEMDEVLDSMRSGWVGTGPKVARLEEMFKEYKGCANAVAVSSCTAALHLSMLAIGIAPGDEVIVPAMTFAATANAVIHAGGRPVLADCGRENMNIDPADVERRITPRTRAIIPVHFAGRPCDMDAILAIASRSRPQGDRGRRPCRGDGIPRAQGRHPGRPGLPELLRHQERHHRRRRHGA